MKTCFGVLGLVICVLGCSDGGSSPSTDAGGDGGIVRVPAAQTTPTPDGLCTSCDACEEDLTLVSERHVDAPLDYADPPPAGGDHNPCWSTWGVHTEPVADENWVHNLEHGGVIYLYNCPDGCDAEVQALSGFVEGRELSLLTPYPALPVRFAAVSWGHRLVSDCFDQAVFEAFYDKRVDQAPESVTADPAAACLTK